MPISNNKMRAGEELLSAPLPELIRELGLSVAKANQELAKIEGEGAQSNIVYAINNAEIEIKIALSYSKSQEAGVEAGGSLFGFALNASYKGTFGFSEEASSTIKLNLSAKPAAPTTGG
jgi:hypothetical protein